MQILRKNKPNKERPYIYRRLDLEIKKLEKRIKKIENHKSVKKLQYANN